MKAVKAIMLAILVLYPMGIMADDETNRFSTGGKSVADCAACQRVAQGMMCCHCYKPMPDGTRFYFGVLEAGFCRSKHGYCEGYAPCSE
jgi:hypothetical protein